MNELGVLSIIGGAMMLSASSMRTYLRSVEDPAPQIAYAIVFLAGIAKLVGSIGVWLLVICAITASVQWAYG